MKTAGLLHGPTTMQHAVCNQDFKNQESRSWIPGYKPTKHELSEYRLPINCLAFFSIEIDSYKLLPQGDGEKRFSDHPLDGGIDRALNFLAIIFTVHLIFKKHSCHCYSCVP